jgi:hypothetical protein
MFMRFAIELRESRGEHVAWLAIHTLSVNLGKQGNRTCSGDWSFAEVPTPYLGNWGGVGGKFYSKELVPECNDKELYWAGYCRGDDEMNQHVFFFDTVQPNPFLILRDFSPLYPRGHGRAWTHGGEKVWEVTDSDGKAVPAEI